MDFVINPHATTSRTVTSRAEASLWLAAMVEASAVNPVSIAGFSAPTPRPMRTPKIDPETKLKRARHSVSKRVAEDFARHRQDMADRAKLAEMADSL